MSPDGDDRSEPWAWECPVCGTERVTFGEQQARDNLLAHLRGNVGAHGSLGEYPEDIDVGSVPAECIDRLDR